MPTPEARSTPRVSFHAAVELVAQTEDDPAPRALSAEVLDLGAGGMRVAVAERLPIGAPLTCRVTLDGQATSLGGHVVWLRSHTSPRPHGMGIRFDVLKENEQRLLSQVIESSSAGYRPVQLQFDGTSAAVVARARPNADGGLTLSSPLPILDRGAGVEVRLEADGDAQRGRVGEVRVVESGSQRRLEVEIALGEAEVARFRREARFASGGLEEIPLLHDADRTQTTPEAQRPANRASMALSLLAALAFGVAGGLALAGRVPGPWASAPAAEPRGSVLRAPRPAAAATPITSTSTPAPPSANAAILSLAVTNPAHVPAQPSAGTAPALVSPQSPSVSVEADATVLRLPFSGSLEGMVARIWATPAVLALDLPGGHVELGPGAHVLHGGSIAGLRVNARADANLLRVRLAAPIGRYAVSAHDGVLELRIFAAQ